MSHAQIPDFSHALPTPSTTFRVRPADPILAAIDAHAEAWAVFQVAPEGRETHAAETALHAALDTLLTTPCASRFGALALVRHLRWYIAEEAVTGSPDDVTGRLVLMREADLSRFVGSDLHPVAIPRALPLGRLGPAIDRQDRHAAVALHDEPTPGGIEPWQAVAPVRPDTAHVRARRFIDAGADFLAAITIIAGGVVFTGLATLI